MKREVIQDFLNLPGIAGVALMDGRSRPYFCGIDQALNFQQKEALAQGILQVVETIPDSFESFEFQFTGYRVHIYKLDRGMILLVLTHHSLVYSEYLKTIQSLKAVLEADTPNAIATFRLMAGNTALTGLSDRATSTSSSSQRHLTTPTAQPTSPPVPADPVVTPPGTNAASAPATPTAASLKEAIKALNDFSQFTTQYLGNHVIVNYWKSTRPDVDWLGCLQVERSAQFTFTGTDPQALQQPLSHQEQQWIRDWVAAFVKRCTQVIRDFPTIIQKALNAQQKALLLE